MESKNAVALAIMCSVVAFVVGATFVVGAYTHRILSELDEAPGTSGSSADNDGTTPEPTDTYGVVEDPSMPFRITESGEVGMLGFPITFDPSNSGAPIMTFDQETYEVELDADENWKPEWICTYHAGKKTENYADCSDPWNCQPPEGGPHVEPARYECVEMR